MPVLISVIPAAIERMVSTLRFPQLFLVAAFFFGADLLIPDVIPFADEILLGLLTVLLGTWRQRTARDLEPGASDVSTPREKPRDSATSRR